MRGLIPETALRNSTRVLSFRALLCLAAAIGSVGALSASAQEFCTWNDQFMRWDCPGVGPVTNTAPGDWGAIAYSNSTMNSGSSHGQPSQSDAESVATTNCSSLASDCQPVLARRDLCLALATSFPDGARALTIDPDRNRAAEAALAQCRKNNGTLCLLHATQCGRDDSRYPAPALALPHLPGVNPIVGCFQLSNGAVVTVLPNNKAIGGPFVASWQTVNAAQRMYAITWPQPVTSKVTISADQRSLTGGNQYGGNDTATRISGRSGLVGTWNWVDVVTTSRVTVTSDNSSNSAGTFTNVSSNATWHGKWQATGAQSYTMTFSDLPLQKLTLTADGSRLSGTDQYANLISATRAATCNVN
jgi:hypothetical protein